MVTTAALPSSSSPSAPSPSSLLGRYQSPLVQAVVRGLLAAPRSLPEWVGHDAAGLEILARLQARPTSTARLEQGILDADASDVARFVGSAGRVTVVDGAFGREAVAVPDTAALRRALEAQHVVVDHAVVADGADLDVVAAVPGPRCVVLGHGVIAGLDKDAAGDFLQELHDRLQTGDWLILAAEQAPEPEAVDSDSLLKSYNQNILARLNREARARFDVERFQHRVVWNPRSARIETYLESTQEQLVPVDSLGLTLRLQKGDRIKTGGRRLWSDDDVAGLLEEVGFARDVLFVDADDRVGVHLARV